MASDSRNQLVPGDRDLTGLDAAEVHRLAVLDSYEVLDTASELPFDDLVELAARACGVPMAAISLVDADRQWFKAGIGLPAAETPREQSFCAHAIAKPAETLVIENAAADPRFAANPLVTDDPGIRAYAGVPLLGTDDQPLGALCVIDEHPRTFEEGELDQLRELARRVEALLELRRVSAEWRVRAEDDRFAIAFRLAPVPMNLVGVDGRVLLVNDAMAALMGADAGSLPGKPVQDLIAAGDHAAEADLIQRLASGEIESSVRPGTLQSVEGEDVAVLATTSAVRDRAGNLLFFLTSLEDISQRVRAEDALALTHTATEAIVATDSDGHIVFWNAAATTMFGHRSSEVMGRPVTIIIPERDRDDHLAEMERLRQGQTSDLVGTTAEVTALRASGQEFPVELSLSEWFSRGEIHYTTVIRDITERRELEAELVRRAEVDALTGLASRDRFTRAVTEAVEAQTEATVILADLDQFKQVNDSLGYVIGDRVLTSLAGRLRGLMADGALLARFGGDEFALLLHHGTDRARGRAGEISEALNHPVDVGAREITLGASIGIAPVRPDRAPRTAIRQAETALHQAKAAGRGRVEVFSEHFQTAALERLQLEADLREALANDHLTVRYQPEFDIATGRPCAMEALARWSLPGRGPVSPGEFIPLAEATGLILPLGRWVLERALADLAALDRVGDQPVGLAVNVSSQQLNDPAFPSDVADIIERSGVDPRRLTMEITESTVMEDLGRARQRIEGLAALGITIAIDDFGTGYSSLAALHRLPVSVLKIDKSFVDPLPEQGHAMVETIVALARSLGLTTIAEGIEHPEQLALLREVGVDIAQGFLLARPTAPIDLRGALAAEPVAMGRAASHRGEEIPPSPA